MTEYDAIYKKIAEMVIFHFCETGNMPTHIVIGKNYYNTLVEQHQKLIATPLPNRLFGCIVEISNTNDVIAPKTEG